ncbi:hypothetical protein SAMN04515667_1730 [Formosa sp. Hel1_31_208]|uniref:thioredoxin domain-containing protein n=1 Tax=Formosa sp. Hel1_31_208 TaxID=1798225 RepID=UPI00087D4C1E|nr:thioredoxin domain-containing protein [Formosa sp. Hel1_31_208]SDS24194.1 hypothetical protein SAMN04515667_1730 [Formosa sp. Hel1_31_208]
MLKHILFYFSILVTLTSCSQKSKPLAQTDSNKANDLIHETSPYLLQHAYNPVAWKAWNPETLQLAKDQNKLMIISVGYSACHWCHVMEEESFENDSIAKLMNENFINIKVDREERPDIDQIYMNAVQLMTGSGGWPLNCIALPDGRPVFGGTYFTKEQWTDVLVEISTLYNNDPEKMIAYAENLTEGIKNSNLITVNKEEIPFNQTKVESIISDLKKDIDYRNGGQKNAPKFPMPDYLNLLLRASYQYKDEQLNDFVETTLVKMANGGIYDQIGGGFSRYSVDERWHIPHFEKMLYDNAQLVSLYSKAYQLTKNKYFTTIIDETLEFIDRDLTDENGAFYSSLDADSKTAEGELEEGAYYVWTKDELKQLLGEDYTLFENYYNINSVGKWEKDNYVLYKTKSNQEFSEKNNMSIEALKLELTDWKTKLNAARNERDLPRKDDKVLSSWNSLMLNAYVDAYRVLGEPMYLNRAINNANFLIEHQIKDDGSMYHNYKNGKSTIDAFSEDYAHTISALIALYQVTFNEKWLHQAKQLMDYSIQHFINEESGMFYFTSDTETNLITRKTEVIDNVIPSSNSVFAENLFKLGHYYANTTYSNMAKQMLSNMNSSIMDTPSGYSNWLELYINYANPYYEVALAGPNAHAKLKELDRHYLPNILIAGATSNSQLPLLDSKYNDDETYIYVCVNGSCKLPVTETDRAIKQLEK